jgi:hypothetical protein
MLAIDGRIIHPVQDCTGSYGAALRFAAIEALSSGDYRQREIARVVPWGRNTGLHTYNRSASFETVDLFGPAEAR